MTPSTRPQRLGGRSPRSQHRRLEGAAALLLVMGAVELAWLAALAYLVYRLAR